ncbi:hypothetical protein CGA21_05445 [Pseudomonas sp. PSB11]|nr:hypothetical protein [Pseudomonas sp. PSB11]
MHDCNPGAWWYHRRSLQVAPLARQLSWAHNLIIFGQSRHPQEREFYLRSSIGRGLNQTLIPISHKHHTLRDMALRGLPV